MYSRKFPTVSCSCSAFDCSGSGRIFYCMMDLTCGLWGAPATDHRPRAPRHPSNPAMHRIIMPGRGPPPPAGAAPRWTECSVGAGLHS
jgi:hypothetical protein